MIEIIESSFLAAISQRFWRNLDEFSLKSPFISDQVHLQLSIIEIQFSFLEFPNNAL